MVGGQLFVVNGNDRKQAASRHTLLRSAGCHWLIIPLVIRAATACYKLQTRPGDLSSLDYSILVASQIMSHTL